MATYHPGKGFILTTDAGIVSISLTHESVTDQQGDGQLARRGAFTWQDGTQGSAGEIPG